MQPNEIQDPHFPAYHFAAGSRMNDPQPFFWNGEYHVFFLHHDHPTRRRAHRGHAASRDLVHWQQLPRAFSPTPGGPDRRGCWTGSFAREKQTGRFYTVYTGCISRPPGPLIQTQNMAYSDDLVHWNKYTHNPLAIRLPDEYGRCWRDPLIWQAGESWRLLMGSALHNNQGGAALLYGSDNLQSWTFLNPLHTDPEMKTGSRYECPDFFPLQDRHVLLTSDEWRTYWRVGERVGDTFQESYWGAADSGDYYAAKTMIDDQGRRILIGWITPARRDAELERAGWSGALALPRQVILLADGTIGFQPVPELKLLRQTHYEHPAVEIKPGSPQLFSSIRGKTLEIKLQIDPHQADSVHLLFHCPPDCSSYTELAYHTETHTLGGNELNLTPQEPLNLQVFIDHSIIEVFANGRACHTMQAYPDRDDSQYLAIQARGGPVEVSTLEYWELAR